MNRGILFASLIAFAWSGLGLACRTPANETQIGTVDSMITRLEAAKLTLNELDRSRYDRAAALYRSDEHRFLQRFQDTLDRSTALLLGNHFNVLRAAADMGRDHNLVADELVVSQERLRALRNDMVNGAFGAEEATLVMGNESKALELLDADIQQVITNYKSVQRAWDDLATVDTLLVSNPHNAPQP